MLTIATVDWIMLEVWNLNLNYYHRLSHHIRSIRCRSPLVAALELSHDTSCGSLLSSLPRLGCDRNTLCVCHLCQHQLCHNTVNYLLLEDSMQWHAHCVFPHDGTTAFIRDLFLGTTWKSHLLCDASRTKFLHPFSTGWMLTWSRTIVGHEQLIRLHDGWTWSLLETASM